MKALLTLIALTVSAASVADWRWTPWVPTNGASTFSQARQAAYNYAVQECLSEELEHNQSTTYQDWDGMNSETGFWDYKSRHYFNCVVPQGYQVPCNGCGRGEDCIRAVAASNAIDNAETYCAQWGLTFDFYAPGTQFDGITTPACSKEPHEGHEWMGRYDIVTVSGVCEN